MDPDVAIASQAAGAAAEQVAALEAWFSSRPATGRMRELVGDAGVLERRAQGVLDALAAVRAVAPPAVLSHPTVDPRMLGARALVAGVDALEHDVLALREELLLATTALADAASAVRALAGELPAEEAEAEPAEPAGPAEPATVPIAVALAAERARLGLPPLPAHGTTTAPIDDVGAALIALAEAPRVTEPEPETDEIGLRLVELAAALADETPKGPRRRRRAYRAAHAGLAVLFVAGACTVADGAITLAWKEPLTSFYATWQQHTLDHELSDLRRGYEKATNALILKAPPDRLRGVAALAAKLDRTTPTGHALGRLVIPKIGLNMVVDQGTNAGSLKRGPGHYRGTALPGGSGTVGIAGHRTTFLAPFRHIDRLHRGDIVQARMPYGTFTYRVTRRQIVKPSQVSVLTSSAANDRIVLTACHPVGSASHRIVVTARLAITDITKRG